VRIEVAFWGYILQSETTGKLYTGQTSDLERRLREHNDEEIGRQRFTRKQSGPWRLLYSEEMPTRTEALKREKYLKTGKGREWIKQSVLRS
jgi:putative endonuclease